MTDRRIFIKTALTVASGMVIGQSASVMAGISNPPLATSSYPDNIVYTAKNPGKWLKKVGGHAPKVTIQGKTLTIITDHGMSDKHFIVRHTLVSANGTVLGGQTFSPSDDKAISTFPLPSSTGKFYATSFCNKHDFWVTEFTL